MGNMRVPEAVIFETDSRCYDLRKAGLTYRQIAKAIDCSPARAYHGVQRIYKSAQAKFREDAEETLQLELDRLDSLLQHMWPLTMPHDITTEDGNTIRVPADKDAVDRVLKIMDRRAKLLGLDQISVTHTLQGGGAQVGIGPRHKDMGEISPKEEGLRLMQAMAEAGVIEAAVIAALRKSLGLDDAIDAEVIADHPELLALDSGHDDGDGYFEGMIDEDDESTDD